MRLLALAKLSFLFAISLVGKVAAFQKNGLFGSAQPLEIELKTSLNELKLSNSDTVYFDTYLRYKSEIGNWDSLKVELRARGNSRRTRCEFPPVRIKISKKEAENTLFEGEKALKLVLPCEQSADFDDLIYKEFLIYKFYEQISPYYFQTRLVDLNLTTIRGRKSKTYQLVAFLIEDDDKAAKRYDGKISNAKMVRPNLVNDTIALKQDFFSFMVGNTDWSNTTQHNVKIMERKDQMVVPIPYDFDMAGFVGAPYAIPYSYLPIKTVQERLYRGICRDPALEQSIKTLFLMKEQTLFETLASFKNELQASSYKTARDYLSQFYQIIKDDAQFEAQIRSQCIPNTY